MTSYSQVQASIYGLANSSKKGQFIMCVIRTKRLLWIRTAQEIQVNFSGLSQSTVIFKGETKHYLS